MIQSIKKNWSQTTILVFCLILGSCASKNSLESKDSKRSSSKGHFSEENGASGDSSRSSRKGGPHVASKDDMTSGDALENEGTNKQPESNSTLGAKSQQMESPAWVRENYQQKQYKVIEKKSHEVLSANPKDHLALNALGLVHYARGEFLAAHYMYQRALDSQPKSGTVYNNLGVNFLARKMDKEAIASFKKCLELEPSNGKCAAQLGALYLKYRDPQKSLSHLEIAKRQGVNDLAFKLNYAVALVSNGKTEEAKSIYEEGLKADNNQLYYVYNYAILLIDHLKNYKEGGLMLDKLKFIGPVQEMKNKIIQMEKKVNRGLQ